MSRYIDIDKALSQLYLDHKDVIYIDKEACAKRIKALQTIDIVRCKECKWWCGNLSDEDGFLDDECRWRIDEAPNADDFCSYGERRE